MKRKPKIQLVREHLEKGQTITQATAARLFHYYRLADGIHKLRHRCGLNIITHSHPTTDGLSSYAEYELLPQTVGTAK